MTTTSNKSLMRSLGEFVGHIVRAVRTDPPHIVETGRSVQSEDHGDMVLRRTTIDEIELKGRKVEKSKSRNAD